MARAIDGLGDVLLEPAAIEQEVARLGAQISGDYADKHLHLVGVLKGSALFVADLVRELTIPATLDFISTVPYAEASASGVVLASEITAVTRPRAFASVKTAWAHSAVIIGSL